MKINDLLNRAFSPQLRANVLSLCGGHEAAAEAYLDRISRLAGLYHKSFPEDDDVRLFSTPGRTELCGNHTDHEHGKVLCASVNIDILALAAAVPGQTVTLISEGFSKEDVIDLSILEPVAEERGHSASLIRGVARALADKDGRLGGFHAYTTNQIPAGGGLSSSAAFEVLVGSIFNGLYNNGRFSPLDLARSGQFAENVFFDKPSGLMDQCGCAVGGYIALDFEDPAAPRLQNLQFDLAGQGYSLVITQVGGGHQDLTHEYAAIPAEMQQIARALGGNVLRDVEEETFKAALPGLRREAGDRAILRAMHFYAEQARVDEAVNAVRAHDVAALCDVLNRSGRSSWTLLQNVTAPGEIRDQETALALAASQELLAGKGSVRVHGGGFGGTIQAIVPQDLVEEYTARMESILGRGKSLPVQIRAAGTTEINA